MYQTNENIIARKIHGSFFLINITDNYIGDRCALYEINEIGKFLWDNMSTPKTIEELANLVKNAIVDDVEYQTIYSDVMEFVHKLLGKEFIFEVKLNG